MKRFVLCVLFVILLVSAHAIDFDNPRYGVRGGIGIDITLVPAFGGELSAAFDSEDGTWLEFDLGYFYSHDSWDNSSSTEEVTTNLVLLRANRLYNYEPGKPGTFYIAGTGAAVISWEWEETSTFYTDSDDGTGGGLLATIGIGQVFNNGLEVRLDLPVLIIFNGYYGTSFAPMLGLTAGMRF